MYLGCFQFEAITYKADTDIHVKSLHGRLISVLTMCFWCDDIWWSWRSLPASQVCISCASYSIQSTYSPVPLFWCSYNLGHYPPALTTPRPGIRQQLGATSTLWRLLKSFILASPPYPDSLIPSRKHHSKSSCLYLRLAPFASRLSQVLPGVVPLHGVPCLQFLGNCE